MASMKKGKVHILVQIDDDEPIELDLKDCDLSYSIQYDIETVYEPGRIEPTDLRYTGKTNFSLSAREFREKKGVR